MFQFFFKFWHFLRKIWDFGDFFPLVYIQLILLISGKSHQIFNITKLKLKNQTRYCPLKMEGLNFINPTLPYYFWIMLKRHIPLVASFATNYFIFRNVDILTPPKKKFSQRNVFWWRKLEQIFIIKIQKYSIFNMGSIFNIK